MLNFPLRLPNQLTSARLEQDLSRSEKSCITSYYNFLRTKNNNKIKTSFVNPGLQISDEMKLELILYFFSFYYPRKGVFTVASAKKYLRP